MALNDRHKKFCEEYVIDLNGAQAYIRAGYKVANGDIAATNANKLLRNAQVQAYIQKLKADRSKRTEITADRVLQELGRIGFGNITEAFHQGGGGLEIKDLKQMPPDVSAAISEISEVRSEKMTKCSVKMHNKMAALTLLAQHLGITSDFNQCLTGLRKYGLQLWQDADGKWQVSDANAPADESELSED